MKWDSITGNTNPNKGSAWKAVRMEKTNHHFVFIEAPVNMVSPQIILWGEASWWPKDCQMRFKKRTPGEIRIGTEYEQRVRAPFAGSFSCRVTQLDPSREIERTFLTGMFKGRENVMLEERYNGTKVSYTLFYELRGILNVMLWPVLFQQMHDKNINKILAALKKYCEEKANPLENP